MDEVFVQRFLKPWNDHDVEGAMALMTDDCLWEIPRGADPCGTRFQGADAVRGVIAGAFRAVPDIRYDLIHSAFGLDLVVLELLVTGTLPDGRLARFQACDVMTVRDGSRPRGPIARSWSSVMTGGIFAVINARGPNWDDRKPMEEQGDWRAHADFMNALVDDGFVLLGGPLTGTRDVLLVVRAADEAEIAARLDKDIWVAKGLLQRRQINPWWLRLGSL